MSRMISNSFQIGLPSDDSPSKKIFPDNKPQDYKIKLCEPLYLNGEWEFAVIDIQYPGKWIDLGITTTLEVVFYDVLYEHDRKLFREMRSYIPLKTISESPKSTSQEEPPIEAPKTNSQVEPMSEIPKVDSQIQPTNEISKTNSQVKSTSEAQVQSNIKSPAEIPKKPEQLYHAKPYVPLMKKDCYGKLKNNLYDEYESNEAFFVSVKIERGKYATIESLGKYVVSRIREAFPQSTRSSIHFEYNSITKQSQIRSANLKIGIFDKDPTLASLLGIKTMLHDHLLSPGDEHPSTWQWNLDGWGDPTMKDQHAFETIYIYSNLGMYQYIGSGKYPTIGSLPAKLDGTGQQQYFSWGRLNYMPVAQHVIEDIEIKLITNKGDLIPFESGTTIVNLCFRPKA